MKIVDIEQNTPEWLDWRQSGYSASDAPAVMAEGAFFPSTPFELYLKLTGQRKVVYTEAMKAGHEHEAQIVQYASESLELQFKPACIQKGDFLASIDGLAFKNDKPVLLEVKTTKIDSKIWNEGQKLYKWQMVHQALVAGTDGVYFCVYARDADAYRLDWVEVTDRDKQLLLTAWESFGASMRNLEPPALTPGKDYVENNSAVFADLAEQYQVLQEDKKAIEKKIANVKTELLKIADGKHTKGAGISIYEVKRKGAIDYDKIDELQEIDLEQYRKEPSSYWVIK